MGQKDLSEKILFDYNDVFADVVNVLLYEGEQVVEPPDKYMPFRVIGYDGAAYRSQLIDKRKSIVPVVTIVLYFGTDRRWNQPRSVRELVEIPKGLEEYVNDYKVHVFEVAWFTDEQLRMFKSDFGIVANYFVQKRRNKDYIPDDERVMQHVDEVLKLLSVMTGDDRFEKLLYVDNEKGGVRNMCEVLDRAINKGETMLALLIEKLFADGRTEDARLAASDEEARRRFYKEYGIID